MSASVPQKVRSTVDSLSPQLQRASLIASGGGLAGFVGTVFIYFGLQRIFQHLSAYQLIDAMQGSSTTFCFAGITASSTILPLMLTIFSFARRAEVDFNQWFYRRIKSIALLCCVAFVCGLVTLTVLSAPIGDMSEVSNMWYRIFYYIIVFGLASMVGVLLSVLILLYFSILYIVDQLNPHTMRARKEAARQE